MNVAPPIAQWNAEMKALCALERDLKYSLLAAFVLAMLTYSFPVR